MTLNEAAALCSIDLRTADMEALRKRKRDLLKKYHPDNAGNDAIKMAQLISEALTMLESKVTELQNEKEQRVVSDTVVLSIQQYKDVMDGKTVYENGMAVKKSNITDARVYLSLKVAVRRINDAGQVEQTTTNRAEKIRRCIGKPVYETQCDVYVRKMKEPARVKVMLGEMEKETVIEFNSAWVKFELGHADVKVLVEKKLYRD